MLNNWKKHDSYYRLYYAYKMLSNLALCHQAKVPKRQQVKSEHNFILSQQLKDEWYRAFSTSQEVDIPFTYFARETNSAIVCINMLSACRLNIGKLLHVKSSLWVNPVQPLEIDLPYRIHHELDDLIPVTESRVCFIGKTSVLSPQHEPIMVVKNAFLIRGLKAQDTRIYHGIEHHPKHTPDLFIGLSSRKSQLISKPQTQRIPIHIPAALGKRYGLLSGDLNPIHTNPYIAKLIKADGAFIQGLCTLNLLVSVFRQHFSLPFEKINMTFCSKVYENQEVYLLTHQADFELVDSHDQLLVYGKLKLPFDKH